jgi:hypothetical protein
LPQSRPLNPLIRSGNQAFFTTFAYKERSFLLGFGIRIIRDLIEAVSHNINHRGSAIPPSPPTLSGIPLFSSDNNEQLEASSQAREILTCLVTKASSTTHCNPSVSVFLLTRLLPLHGRISWYFCCFSVILLIVQSAYQPCCEGYTL